MNSSKILNRLTLKSSQTNTIPCEWCLLLDSTTPKNYEQIDSHFIGSPCSFCEGTGYLKMHSPPDLLYVIQSVLRHKLKEVEFILKSVSVRQ